VLVARLMTERIEAALAKRGPEYRCPQCSSIVVLKKGRQVVHHFAHKPPTDCSWARGETRAHLEAKSLFATALIGRGLKAHIEFVLHTLPGDRRADVMAWSPKGTQIAFELQHTQINLDTIEKRASSYAVAGVAQIWIPFLRPSVWKDGEACKGGWLVKRYSPRPFEKWVHGLNRKQGMWMYDPAGQELWLGQMTGHKLYVEESTWYSEGGEENTGGGFSRWSKRYKQLTLVGPYKVDQLLVVVDHRSAYSAKGYNWPAGRVAHLTPQE
jgi:DNA-directed RNA polymerase subunit RPC12/RpoP